MKEMYGIAKEWMMNAIIYARQSSGADDVSDSVENQIENCRKLAVKEGVTVLEVCSDLNTSGKTYPAGAESLAEGDSAFLAWYNQQTGSRKYRAGLGKVFRRLAEIDYIIVDEMTRLYRPATRSFLESFVNQKLTENQVKILQVKGGHIDLSKFDQSLIQTLKNAIQDEAIANQKAKSKQQLAKLRDSGIIPNGARAFGLVYEGDRKIRVDQDCAECIRFVFDGIAAYKPYNAIVRNANERFRHLFPKCFYSSNLYHIARNPLYAGYMYNTAGELIRNVQLTGQEIVSFCEWQKVQEIMSEKRRNPPGRSKKHWLPMSGRICCGNCGGRMICLIDNKKIFYWCKNGNFLQDEKCRKSRIRFEGKKKEFGLYETIMPLLVIALIERHQEACLLLEAKDDFNDVQFKIHEMEAKENDMFDLVMDGTIPKDRFESMVKKHRAKRLELESQLRVLEETDFEATELLKEVVITKQLNELVAGKIDKVQYEQLFHDAIRKITVWDHEITVETIYGEVTIPRLRYKNRKFFPAWEMVLAKNSIGIDEHTKVTITYLTTQKSRIADFGALKIQSK